MNDETLEGLREALREALEEQNRLRRNIMQYTDRAASARDSLVRMREKIRQQRAKIVELELTLTTREQELRDMQLQHEAHTEGLRQSLSQVVLLSIMRAS